MQCPAAGSFSRDFGLTSRPGAESPLASFSISASSVNLTKKHERKRGSSERKEDSSLPSGSLLAAAVSGYEKSMFCQRSLPIICEREDE